MTRSPILLLAAFLGLSGCASMQPGRGFDDVQRSVSERTGMQVHWDNGSPDDEEAATAVRSLLEHELTPEAAVQVALLNNRALQAIYEELDIAQADLVQAGLLNNPVFGGEVRFATDGGGSGVVLDLTQEFVSLLYMPLRKGRAGAEFEAAKLRVTLAVLDLAGETRIAFYEYQAAQQLLEMRRSVAEATAASYELAKRLREAGNNRDLDVSNERALHEQSRLDLAAAEAAVFQRREELNELMGLWGPDTGWNSGERLPEIPAEEVSPDGLEQHAVERSLDLAVARREIEVAARTLGIARPMALLGELDAGVAAEREVEGGWSVGPSFALSIPLFDQGQAATGKARAQLSQAAHKYVAEAVSLRARVRAAYLAVTAARDRAQYYAGIVLPLRQQIVDQTQLQYNAMQIGAFQLLQAKRDQIEAGARYIDALRDYWIARTTLDQILSGRSTRPGSRLADSPAPFQKGAMTSGGGH